MGVSQIFLPLRGTNSTTTNYITGTANFEHATLSSQGLSESIVINLYPNKAYHFNRVWQQSFLGFST